MHPDRNIDTSNFDHLPFLNLYPRDGDLGPLWDQAYNDFAPFDFLDPLAFDNVEAVDLPLSPISPESCSTPTPTKHCAEENPPPVSDVTRKALIDFYLEEVAGTLSCFDGPLNPFRNSVASLLETSPALESAAQSMAAACLAQNSHTHKSLANQLRQEADARVQEIIESGEPNFTTVFTLAMLGFSAEWHDPNDHGEKFWRQSLDLLRTPSTRINISAEEHYFFRNALAYWRLSNSLSLADELLDTLPAPLQHAPSIVTWTTPHPWTGVSEAPIRLLGRVSNLLKSSGNRFAPGPNVIKLQEHLQEAAQLECELLRLRLPDEELILNSHDERTPTSHLIQVGEVYRLCGLIRLYRGFPHLLCRSDYSVRTSSPPSTSSSPLQTFGISTTAASEVDANGTIRHLVKRALSILERIPLDSGVRLAQPFLLTTLASELRLSKHPGSTPTLSSIDMEMLRARRFVTGRLSALDAHTPPYRMYTMIDFVKRIWEEMDADDDG
ncbi:c6 zinc finger domain containing protein [Diplodia corticola]|uniref:C6 zinc finger domain containing protein n=1 Tax=Diplodia corticola TaxID=236234 RepID=A0A1J9S5N8_9PEZI|nr:c6 zinc finger domain containing protein [Diplodia corticola]OJD34925.1 c6 zinc finger domain containing protein [Diplodia corticola]